MPRRCDGVLMRPPHLNPRLRWSDDPTDQSGQNHLIGARRGMSVPSLVCHKARYDTCRRVGLRPARWAVLPTFWAPRAGVPAGGTSGRTSRAGGNITIARLARTDIFDRAEHCASL